MQFGVRKGFWWGKRISLFVGPRYNDTVQKYAGITLFSATSEDLVAYLVVSEPWVGRVYDALVCGVICIVVDVQD